MTHGTLVSEANREGGIREAGHLATAEPSLWPDLHDAAEPEPDQQLRQVVAGEPVAGGVPEELLGQLVQRGTRQVEQRGHPRRPPR